MDDSFIDWLKDILAQYDRVVFLYRLSGESCAELRTILKKEKRKLLLLTDMEALPFSCDQRKLCGDECGRLLERYLSYNFSDRFILLTDWKEFPWPFAANFAEMGLSTKGEVLEALLI